MTAPDVSGQQRLRPLALGEQLDAAIQIYKARWKPMVLASAVVTAPVLLFLTLTQASAGDPEAFTEVDPETNFVETDFRALGIFLAATLIGVVLTAIATGFATAGVFRMVSGLYLGDEPTWQESLRFVLKRARSVLWLLFLISVFQLIGAFLCIIPYFWMMGAFAVAMPAMLVEDARGYAAIERSVGLVKGRFWPTFGAVVIGSILALIVQSVLSAPVLALQAVEANVVVEFIVTAIANIAGTALTLPFTAALAMVIYFDLRVRKEGFDLLLLARRMGVDAPPGGFPKPPGPAAPQPWGAPAFGSAPPGGWHGPPGPYPGQPPQPGYPPPPGGWSQPPPGSYPPPPGGWSQPPPGSYPPQPGYPPPPGGWSQPPPGSYPPPPGGWSQPSPGSPPTEPAPTTPLEQPTTSGSPSGWTEPAGKYVPPTPATSETSPTTSGSASGWTEPAGKYVPPAARPDPETEPGPPSVPDAATVPEPEPEPVPDAATVPEPEPEPEPAPAPEPPGADDPTVPAPETPRPAADETARPRPAPAPEPTGADDPPAPHPPAADETAPHGDTD